MLGPRERTERILRDVGSGSRDTVRVYGPVGLDVGTDGAEQVALSVIAEILAVRSGRRAGALRGGQAPTPPAPGGGGGPPPPRPGGRARGGGPPRPRGRAKDVCGRGGGARSWGGG